MNANEWWQTAAGTFLQAMLNGVWQGLLLVFLLALALRFLSRLNAATRYVIWCLAMLAVGSLPFTNWMQTRREPASSISAPTQAGVFELPLHFFGDRLLVEEAVSDEAMPPLGNGSAPNQAEHRSIGPKFSVPVLFAPVDLGADSAIARWAGHIMAGWALGSFLLLLRIAAAYFKLNQLKRRSLPATADHRACLEKWKRICGSGRPIELALSSEITMPMAAGLRHPKILLPASLPDQLSESELEQLILHELAHLRRRDDWTNLAQQILGAIYFFHPAIRCAGWRLHLQREIACDDFVVAQTAEPKTYALCLARLAETIQLDRGAVAPGAFFSTKQLTRRINMLLDKKRIVRARVSPLAMAGLTGFLGGLILLFSQFPPLVVLGQETRTPKPLPGIAPGDHSAQSKEAAESPAGPRAQEIQLLEQEIQIMEKILGIIQRKHQAGHASETDLLQAQRELLQLKRQLAGLRKPMVMDIRIRPEPLLTHEKSKQLLEEFIRIARDENEPMRLRLTAIQSLADFGTEEIVAELKKIFEETDQMEIQRAAFESLKKIVTVPSTRALLAMYEFIVPGQSSAIRAGIIQTLAGRARTQREMRERIVEKLSQISKEDPIEEARVLALRQLAGFAYIDLADGQ